MTQPDITYNAAQKKLQAVLWESGVNDVSFLATDYLNHLNEPIMMLEMVVDMPEMLDIVESWQLKSYSQHFRDSRLAARELVIEAYSVAPDLFRQPFDLCITLASTIIREATEEIRKSIEAGNREQIDFLVTQASTHVRRLISIASGCINGKPNAMTPDKAERLRQAWVDDLRLSNRFYKLRNVSSMR